MRTIQPCGRRRVRSNIYRVEQWSSSTKRLDLNEAPVSRREEGQQLHCYHVPRILVQLLLLFASASNCVAVRTRCMRRARGACLTAFANAQRNKRGHRMRFCICYDALPGISTVKGRKSRRPGCRNRQRGHAHMRARQYKSEGRATTHTTRWRWPRKRGVPTYAGATPRNARQRNDKANRVEALRYPRATSQAQGPTLPACNLASARPYATRGHLLNNIACNLASARPYAAPRPSAQRHCVQPRKRKARRYPPPPAVLQRAAPRFPLSRMSRPRPAKTTRERRHANVMHGTQLLSY